MAKSAWSIPPITPRLNHRFAKPNFRANVRRSHYLLPGKWTIHDYRASNYYGTFQAAKTTLKTKRPTESRIAPQGPTVQAAPEVPVLGVGRRVWSIGSGELGESTWLGVRSRIIFGFKMEGSSLDVRVLLVFN